MNDNKKQNVSVRMSRSDLLKIKEIAKRIGVRESDVLRFTIKTTLKKLTPLYDANMRGIELVPALTECGSAMVDYFDLDTARLEEIVNCGVDDQDSRVDRNDIELLTMMGIKENYVLMKLREPRANQQDLSEPSVLLRQHLYEKYVQRNVVAKKTDIQKLQISNKDKDTV